MRVQCEPRVGEASIRFGSRASDGPFTVRQVGNVFSKFFEAWGHCVQPRDESTKWNKKMESGTVVPSLPCNNLDGSERFYGRLGFVRIDSPVPGKPDTYVCYRMAKGDFI
jgi:hypothetical protein